VSCSSATRSSAFAQRLPLAAPETRVRGAAIVARVECRLLLQAHDLVGELLLLGVVVLLP
jgi:hypothetical protein